MPLPPDNRGVWVLNYLTGDGLKRHGRHAAESALGDRRDIHLPAGQHGVFHPCQRWLEKVTGDF